MTRRELNLAILEGKADGVLWQPRLETWIDHHMKQGTMPARLRGLDDLGIYDALRCSIRYEVSRGLVAHDPEGAVYSTQQQGDHFLETITTPAGSITTVNRGTWADGGLQNWLAHSARGTPVLRPRSV